MKRRTALFLGLLSHLSVAMAQQQGNVVEYFGKERVEKVEEGRVIHRFQQGLLLNDAIRPGMLLGNQDIVLWQHAAGKWEPPVDGQTVLAGFPQGSATLQWKNVEADTNHVFTGMQRGWLYAEYFSETTKVVLLDATGHTMALVNGLPYEGDHYDYGYTLHPVELKQGRNEFLFSYGRFSRLKAALVEPERPVMLLRRDMTLPPLLIGNPADSPAGIRLLNSTANDLNGLKLRITLETGETMETTAGRVPACSQRKVIFMVPGLRAAATTDRMEAVLQLVDSGGVFLHEIRLSLKVQDPKKHHERTFLSRIDGSVQYYSLMPSLSPQSGQPLVLSLHGASVEATNQTRAYKAKDWMHLVAPTNRRPFGFNWEDWGRIDAFEVLAQARKVWDTDTLRTYVTGHSMGGHGTWVTGGTYPGLFAAMAPAAGYPDIIEYRRTGSDTAFFDHPHFRMLYSAALHARMPEFTDNYVQTPLYVLHGDADEVVPVQQARRMRELLGPVHPHMEYYEYPGGTHWYGDESMDWPPLFNFLKTHSLRPVSHRDTVSLLTANIGVSATSGWLTIGQQLENGRMSRAKAVRSPRMISINTTNVRILSLSDEAFAGRKIRKLLIDGQTINSSRARHFVFDGNRWKPMQELPLYEKHPGRNGGFKTAFDHDFMLIYGTGGTPEEQQWNRRRALFDAEAFLYRANGAPEVLADTLLTSAYAEGRNVVLYGNADNNMAWKFFATEAPFRAGNGYVELNGTRMEGSDIGFYVVYPKPGSTGNLIGLVGGTGPEGMKAAVQNHYFSGITAFPDLMVFRTGWLMHSVKDIALSGFFGYDWSAEKGRWEK